MATTNVISGPFDKAASQFFNVDKSIHLDQIATGGEPPDNGDMEARLTALEIAIKELPTKGDFAGVRADFSDLRADFAGLKTEMVKVFGEVRTEMHKGTIETQRWMIATVIGLFLGFGGLFLAMSNALKPASTPTAAAVQAQPPVIINMPPQATPVAAPSKK